MKSHTRLLVSILTIAMVANATGCSAKTKNNEGEIKESIVIEEHVDSSITENSNKVENIEVKAVEEPIITEIEKEARPVSGIESIEKDSEKSIEELLYKHLYDENMDYNLVINTYLNTDYDKRSELENDYLRALYMLLINSSALLETYLNELNTMAIMQQVPMCVPDDVWYDQFGNLLSLLNEYESLFEKFGPLAYYVHDLKCELDHTFDECGCYTCPELQDEYKLILKLNSDEI